MKNAILNAGLTAEEMEHCRLLLLKAMDETLPRVNRLEPLIDSIARRQAHRAKFDEISQAAGWGPLIRATQPTPEQTDE